MNRIALRRIVAGLSLAALLCACIACGTPWVHFTWSQPEAKVTTNIGLWGISSTTFFYGNSQSASVSWFENESNEPFCSNSPTPTLNDIAGRMRWTQYLSILAAVACLCSFLVASMWICNPTARRAFGYVLYFNIKSAVVTGVTIGLFMSVYNACEHNMCEAMTASYANNASCGMFTGFVFAIMAILCCVASTIIAAVHQKSPADAAVDQGGVSIQSPLIRQPAAPYTVVGQPVIEEHVRGAEIDDGAQTVTY